MGNIIGEPFKEYVDKQIKKRQEIHGKVNRTTEEISYLNSTNAWIKLASGVSLTQERLNLLKTEYGNPLVTTTNPGKELAMKNVLFNGVTSMGGTNLVNTPEEDLDARGFLDFMGKDNNEKEYFKQQQRTDFLGPNGAYGMGGNDFGIVPMPGIVSMDSQDLNRGSIKKTRVKLKAYNKNQFDVLDVLYLRLGYTVLLEFGNNRYWDSGDEIKQGTNTLTSMGPTLIDQEFFQTDEDYYNLLLKIEKLRKEKRGNYDAILGKIQNFSWTFAPDGTYDIDLDIISIGDVIESLKVNLPPFGIDPNRAKERQLVRNKFKDREANNINDLEEIYPGLIQSLSNWYDEAATGEDIKIQFRMGLTPKTISGNGANTYDNRNSNGLNVLSNLDYTGNPQTNRGNGSISVSGTPSPSSFNLDELATNNLNYYLKESIKFALITKVNGYYGGNGFKNPLDGLVLSGDVDQNTGELLKKDGLGETLITAYDRYKQLIQNGFLYSTDGNKTTQGLVGTESTPSTIPELFGGEWNGTAGLGGDLKIQRATFTNGNKTVVISNDKKTITYSLGKDYFGSNYTSLERHSALGVLFFPNIINSQSQYPFTSTPGEIRYQDVGKEEFLTAQRNLLKNLSKEEFLNLILEFFKRMEAAGGAQDNQFSDDPEYASFAQELEYEKSRNRIYSWFYRIRKYYTGIVIKDDGLVDTSIGEQDPGLTFGKVIMKHRVGDNDFVSREIGFILNPTDVQERFNQLQNQDNTQPQNNNINTFDPQSFFPSSLQQNQQSNLITPQIVPFANNNISTLYEDWNRKVGYPIYNIKSGNRDVIVLNKTSKEIDFDLEPRFKYFIRLKTLLDFVQDRIIPQIIPSQNINKVPLIKIDTDSNSNICYAIDNMMSSDIRSCIIRNDNVYTTVGKAVLFNNLDFFFPSEGSVNGYTYGRPMNVYMNFEFVQTTIDSLVGNNGEAALFDFLKKICNEINKCLGYVNNLEPTIDYETNTIKIIDQTPIPGIEEIVAVLKDDFGRKVYPNFKPNNPAVLEMYGYNPSNGQSNFVHNIGLTTGISKRYAAMITIGATANGSVPGSEATAFSKWNVGVIDRVKPEIIDPEASKELTLEQQNEGVITNYAKLLTNIDFESNFYKLIQLNTFGSLEPEYLKTHGPVMENFYKYAQAKFSQTGSLESSVGFLPFNLQVDMEGLSGIKIYNRVHVDTRFLPSNYPQTLDFIVTKVNHKVQDNKWDTTLETQATRVLKKDNEGNIIDTPKLYKDQEVQLIVNKAISSTIQQKQRDEAVTPPDKYTGKNGNLPDSELKNLAEIGFPNRKLAREDGAADNFIKMWKDMQAQGIKLPSIGPQGAYRDYEGQYNLFDIDRFISTGKNYVKNTKDTVAAFPGTSNHGWGKSVDIGGKGNNFQKMKCFIRENGAKYGWGWAEGQRINEPWHFTYYGIGKVDDSGYKGKSPCK